MKKCAICLAADKKYAKYTYVTVFSILRNISQDFQCDIVVLTTPDVPEEFTNIFSEMSTPTVKVSAIDTHEYISRFGLDKLFTSRHITYAAYLRLLIPDIFQDKDIVLYLDSDIIVLDDYDAVAYPLL